MSKLAEPTWTTSSMHEQFGVELGRRIFEDLRAALQQRPIGVARGADGRLMVGLRRRDDPDRPPRRRRATLPTRRISERPRREIGGDDVEPPRQLMSRRTARAQGLSRRVGPPNSQCSLPVGDAVLVSSRRRSRIARLGLQRPGEQGLEIVDQAVDALALDLQAEVAPGAFLDRAEIIVGDVEPADDRPARRRRAPASGGCAADSAGP